MSDHILEMRHITKKEFPGVKALDDVSLKYAAVKSTRWLVKTAQVNPR